MKIANFSPFLLLAIALSVGVTGCKKTPKSPTPIFTRNPNAPGGATPGGPESGAPTLPSGSEPRATPLPGSENDLGPREELGNYFLDRETFKQDTVYFEFDRANVKATELPKVQSVATFLAGQPTFKVLVEGHCDERGTPEYNRALGERRALTVRESLMHLGLAGDRIQTISYGEDRPADTGHDTSAWAKNRRAEFVLLKPKPGTPEAR